MSPKRGLFHRGHIALVVALMAVIWCARFDGVSLGDWTLSLLGLESVLHLDIGEEKHIADLTIITANIFLIPALALAHDSDDSKCGAIAKTICLLMMAATVMMLLNLGANGIFQMLQSGFFA